MSEPTIDTLHIAKLSRLQLDESEQQQFSTELQRILAYMETLRQYDVSNVAPCYHPLDESDQLREDVAREGLSQQQALANAPAVSLEQIAMPKVVETA